jgi:hypothetical protein
MLVRELPEQADQGQRWVCGSCDSVWFDSEVAERCCRPSKCQKCSSQARPGWSLCVRCTAQARAIQDENLFRSAAKVFYSEYEGRYLAWTPPGCRFEELFGCRTEIEKRCESLRIPPPRWCWAAAEIGFLLDVEQVLAGAVTRTNEEVRSLLSDEQVEDLQRVLDDWTMKQDLRSYEVDETTAVIFDRLLYETSLGKKLPL